MKKLLIFMMFLAFAIQCNAQYVVDNEPWCPPGATWIYRFFGAMSREYMKFEYAKDTIIEQQAVKKLDVYNISYIGPGFPPDNGARIVYFVGSEYLYESNDSIFWYDLINLEFRFIYKFNPAVGEQFIVGNSRASCQGNPQYPIRDTIIVTTQYSDTFGTRIFNVYSTSSTDSIRLGNVINKIGPLKAPFPEINHSFCSNPQAEYGSFYEEFVCYMDNERGSIQFSNQGGYGDCYTISTSIRSEGKNTDRIYTVYPNPTNNTIKIDVVNKQSLFLQIYNYAGLLVKEQRDFTGEVSVLELPTGMYVAKLVGDKEVLGFGKFIKQ